MNKGMKAAVFWMVIVVSAFLLWQTVKSGGSAQAIPEISYSDFVARVASGQVSKVTIAGKHVLLVEGLVHSGVTSEFLMNDLRARGAASVKLVTLLDRQSARRVPLQPDYFGFLVDDTFLCGYGLGSPEQTGRNLPYLAATI